MDTKVCSKCKEEKPISEFCRDKRRKDGLYPQCKLCCKLYYHENKNLILTQKSDYRKRNIKIIKEYDNKRYNKQTKSHYNKKY